MSIRFLTGRARALRPRLYEELKSALEDGSDAPLIVLVPEQYTLESERGVIAALGLAGSFRLQVMSPARLISRLFEAAGRPTAVRVDERGRVMLMHAALRKNSRDLGWYRGAQHRPGFSELAARQVKELKQAGYTPERLAGLADSLKGPLRLKLADLSVIWSAYEETLSGRFMDGEDELARAVERMEAAPFLRGAQVWAYGFELISPTLATLVVSLAASRQVSLLLPLPSNEAARDAEAFQPVRRTFERLVKALVEAGIDWTRESLEEPPEAQRPAELTHLLNEINCFPPRPYPETPRRVRMASRRNPLDEAMLVMATIRQRAMSGKMRYRDAAIACFDLETYAGALARAAALYEVPVFLESGRGADRNPLAQFLLTALRLVSAGWQAEDMERLMRTGYTALSPDEADRMADCALEQGLRGMLWKKPLHRYRDQRDEELEPLRAKLVEPLAAFEAAFGAANDTRGQLAALWGLLEGADAYNRLKAQEARLKQLGLNEAANENAQVWNRLLTTMDQLAALMGDTHLTARDLSELLSQSLAASDIKPLPQSGDAVMAGSLSHLRAEGVGLLFVMGCNERRATSPGGLFQAHERELLGDEKDVWLAPDENDRARLAGIDLAATLAMAGDFVVFTWSQSDAEGAALQPGAVVGRLRAVFPKLADAGGFAGAEATERLLLNAPDAALSRLSAQVSGGGLTEAARGAAAALYATEPGRAALETLRRAAKKRAVSEDIDRATARRLYGGPTSMSVTRLERYAACPFMHFVQYGLRPVELQPYELRPTDEGTFYHEALKDFLRNTREGLAGLSAEEAVARMDAVAERLLAPMMDGPLSDNPVMLAYSRRMRAVARRAARTVTKQLTGSAFQPFALEVDFGDFAPAVVLHTELGQVPLRGRVDRIDAWNDGDETWLRVIDYKSGQSEMNLSRLYFGLQLQLIIYLAVALGRADSRPAGAFYFKVADPVVDSDSRDPDVVEGERNRALRLSGLYIDDQAVLAAMSPEVDKIVNLTLKNDGTPKSSVSMMDEDGFDLLIRHAIRAAESITRGILSGKTAIAPKKMSGFNACDRCDWRAVCQQDPLLGGMPEQLRPVLEPRDVLETIREELMEEEL